MRLLINELALVFGVQNTVEITNWVNTQYLFKATHEGAEFTLHDVDESKVIQAVMSACTKLQLTLGLLLKGVWVVPVLTPLQLELTASVELRPEAFRLATKEGMRVTQEGVVKTGDIVEITGSDHHIRHEKSSIAGEGVELVYFNAFVNPGPEQHPLSCSMTGVEISEVKRSYIQDKFCGANPFNEQEWSEIQLASVYRRFVSSSIFTALHGLLSAESSKLLQAMSVFGHDMFEQNLHDVSFNVYSSFGKQIGHKVFRHTVSNTLIKKGGGGVVVPFLAPVQKATPAKSTEPAQSSCDDVATEWGAF